MDRYVIEEGLPRFDESVVLEKNSGSLAPVDRAAIPVFAPNRTIEAEAGYLSDATDVLSDVPETSGSYVINGNVYYKFEIKREGIYQLSARLVTPSGNNNSCHVRLGEGHRKTWHMKKSRQWQWQEAPVQWKLAPGEHFLSIEYREPVFLDQIRLTEEEAMAN